MKMFRCGLLVLSPSCIKTRVPSLLSKVSKEVREVLYVDIYHSGGQSLSSFYDLLRDVYGKNSRHIAHLDVRVLLPGLSGASYESKEVRRLSNKPEVAYVRDIFKGDQSTSALPDLKRWISQRFHRCELDGKLCVLESGDGLTDSSFCERETHRPALKVHREAVLGGTFDHIHAGHRLLLGVACLLSEHKVTVGLSEGPLLARKVLKELVEPFEQRSKTVREFIEDVKPGLQYSIVPLTDPIGPSGIGPEYDCLIVSKETEKGGVLVNEARKKNGLSPLDVHVIDLVIDKEVDHTSSSNGIKMSSTAERQKLLGALLKPVATSKQQPGQPYVIGLTGGTASGKSSICKRLEKLGAAVINCDLLGHQAYLPGTKAYQEIIQMFGQGVVADDRTINRKALGAIVFADKSHLARLNQIVWPEIIKLAKREVSKFQEQGFEVCVLDAAVLLEAGWDEFVNEVWVAIIPKSEALSRIQSRDGISQDQAANRIKSQMSNEDRVACANVVLCTLWEPEYTQKQVERAWMELQTRLRPGNKL